MRAKFRNSQVGSQEADFLAAAELLVGRHAGKLGQVLDDPSPPEPSPPLDPLQVNKADVELTRRCFLDEEMAAVEVAMIEPRLMELPGDVGHLCDEAEKCGICLLGTPSVAFRLPFRLSAARIGAPRNGTESVPYRLKPPGDEILQLAIALQLPR